jgi:hypothetical protein
MCQKLFTCQASFYVSSFFEFRTHLQCSSYQHANHQRLTSSPFFDIQISGINSSLPTVSPSTSFVFTGVFSLFFDKQLRCETRSSSSCFRRLPRLTIEVNHRCIRRQKVRHGRESPRPAPARTDGAVTFSPSAGP